jgi:hypothetical protein
MVFARIAFERSPRVIDDRSVNYFGVKHRQPLSAWKKAGRVSGMAKTNALGFYPIQEKSDESPVFVSMVL